MGSHGPQSPAGIALLVSVPVSFASAAFKYRVLDIPVLLQRRARPVLLQRGFLFLLRFVAFGLTPSSIPAAWSRSQAAKGGWSGC
jgi:hypothetical protein